MRIQPVHPPYDNDTAAFLARWMPPGSATEPLALFRLLARHPALSDALRPLGAFQLGKASSLPLADRELVIDRVCALCRCEYEWGVHVTAFGRAWDPKKARATEDAPPDDALWSPRERTLLALVDSLHAVSRVPEPLWLSAAELWTETQLMEILVLAGFYRIIAYLANGFEVDLEPWAERFAGPGRSAATDTSSNPNRSG